MATGDKLVTLDELKLVNDRIKVSGVKGNAESTYRTGDVNLTPANIGAKAVQAAKTSPSASGTSAAFIDTISQDAQGVITATKKTVQNASQSAAGLMSAADKTKLDGIASGAQVNSVTGVKGNAESSYRTGNVNLTPANIGAVSKGGDTMTWGLTLPFMEMKPDTNSSHGGYIDFHFAGTTDDYTVRLIESAEGVLSIRVAGENAYYPIISTKDVRQKALYNTDSNGITAYPTEAGLYRTTGTLPEGMPTGANRYGVLLICGAGTYYMHIYADAVGNVYIAEKGSAGAPASWKKVVRSDDTIAVDNGGTGATTAAAARANIGAMAASPASIELNPGSSQSHGGFIDFHYAGSSTDYTSRIIEGASGRLDILGELTLRTPLGVTYGGTGATTAAAARTNLGVAGTEISSNLQIAASVSVDLSDYTRIECDWQCPGGRIHLSMPEKGVWYAASALSENAATATNYNIYGIKIRFTDSGFEVSYCGYKIMNTGAWTDRLGNSGYTLRRVYGYTWN